MWYHFLHWSHHKSRTDQSRTKKNSRTCEKPKCIPSNHQHNSSFDKKHISNIFLNPYNLWHMDSADLMSVNNTPDWDSMLNQYPQTSTHQPGTGLSLVFSSMRTTDNKTRGLHLGFAFFQRKYLLDYEWTKP